MPRPAGRATARCCRRTTSPPQRPAPGHPPISRPGVASRGRTELPEGRQGRAGPYHTQRGRRRGGAWRSAHLGAGPPPGHPSPSSDMSPIGTGIWAARCDVGRGSRGRGARRRSEECSGAQVCLAVPEGPPHMHACRQPLDPSCAPRVNCVHSAQRRGWQEKGSGGGRAHGGCQGSGAAPSHAPAPQRSMQVSFQAGTWWRLVQTERVHALAQASWEDVPHTVTHVFGVASCMGGRQKQRGGCYRSTDAAEGNMEGLAVAHDATPPSSHLG